MQSEVQSSTEKHLISVIIPTLNEEYSIEQVLKLIPYNELQVGHFRIFRDCYISGKYRRACINMYM